MAQQNPTPPTPGRWYTEGVDVKAEGNGALAYVSVAGARGRTLPEALANAAYIALAVNSLEPLTLALQEIHDEMTSGRDVDKSHCLAVLKKTFEQILALTQRSTS